MHMAVRPDRPELLRRAMVYGTALASFNVEEFGTDRVRRLTREEIAERVRALGPDDLLIALHARRSAASVVAWRAAHPRRGLRFGSERTSSPSSWHQGVRPERHR